MFKIKKIRPMFNMVITTMNEYRDVVRDSGLIDTTRSNRLKEYQTVVAVGPQVKDIKPGDTVFINPRRYAKMTHKDGLKDLDANVQKTDMFYQLDIPTVDVYDRPDGSCRTLLAIFDNDIEFIAEGEEFDENPTVIAHADGIPMGYKPITSK